MFRGLGVPEDKLYLKTGVLWLGNKGGERLAASREAMRKAGVDFRDFDGPRIRKRYPQIEAGVDVEAILEPNAGVLIADKAVQAVEKAATKLGVEVLAEAVRVPISDPSDIRTLRGNQIVARTYVFACGAWLPKVFPDVLGKLIRPTMQENFFFAVPQGNCDFGSDRMPAWIDDTDPRMPYGVPDIAGQGLKMGFHREGPPFDPDTDDRLVGREAVDEARQYLAIRFPALKHAPLLAAKVCQYENSPSGDFLIDRHPDFPNVWFMGGGSGHGFKHGPAVAIYFCGLLLRSIQEYAPFILATALQSGERAVL